jgi:hypothetical protein
MLAVAFYNTAEELRHLEEPNEALRTMRYGYEMLHPLLWTTHQLVQLLEAHAKPVLRVGLLPNKPLNPLKNADDCQITRCPGKADLHARDCLPLQLLTSNPLSHLSHGSNS